MNWKIVAASATGSGHRQKGEECQDAYAWSSEGDWLVAVVSDGAGSARFSQIGAKFAVDTICKELASELKTNHNSEIYSQDILESIILNAIELTRICLARENVNCNNSMEDFHATVVGILVRRQSGTFFQIGDGAGIAIMEKDTFDPIISLPENGEYSDQTFFYTEADWIRHTRFTPINHPVSQITLMTDGAMSFAMAKENEGFDEKFMGPVSRYLKDVDSSTGSKALAATLDDERTHTITSDDKTLLWGLWER
jgi:hypothetical protein